MAKETLSEKTERLMNGERIINPLANNPELAKEYVADKIHQELLEGGYILEVKKQIFQYYGKRDLAQQIITIQPFYYDEGKLWWFWDKNKFCWKITDETNILNFISIASTANTVNSKEKNEILEALKQVARINKPKPIKSTWIQFQNLVYDIDTGNKFVANPEYFITNPLPYKLHPENYRETPNMDRIFEEWVGKDNVRLLYEVLAYCMLPDYPIHRLFCLIGAGMNGKSCFLRLLKKFIGEENITSSELDVLLHSRFEVTRLYKKLVCIMGETNFEEISQTSIIKKLTGQDLIGFEYKNKTPFDGMNYAKILIATNNLPTTTDKTVGFYRRWTIIDFPNTFSEEKDILGDIPDEEYECLSLKCAEILFDLLKARKFTNEGSVEDRIKKYEDRSNFLEKFIKEMAITDWDGYITNADFYKQFSIWCKSNRHREMSEVTLGIAMKELGFETTRRRFEWMNDGKGGQARIWLGIKWKS